MTSEGVPQTISRLMAEGLEHYGQDRVDEAAKCWRAVLRLQPDHEEARDYLVSAGLDPNEEPAGEAGEDGRPDRLLLEVVELSRCGQSEQALELLESLQQGRSDDLRLQAYMELIRAHVFESHLASLDGGKQVPVIRLGPDELMRFNLPANAGFVLSTIDGFTSVNDVVALSGMDAFEVVHAIKRLLDAGILESNA